MKNFFLKLFSDAYGLNEKHIISLCQSYGKTGKWLDLGCDDGSWTKKIAKRKIDWYGVEIVKERARKAAKKGIKVSVSSLEKSLPYSNATFDLVQSNQVIEHLFNIDQFISEIYRVLKPKGILVISTENPASWHNIFALLLGWQMFSATNISVKKLGLGNPLAVHQGKKFEDLGGRTMAWGHNKLLTPRALNELLILHGFKILKTMDKIVYICTGTCKAEISEGEYNKGLTKCGTQGCSNFGHTFEKRMKCHVCGEVYKIQEEHNH